MVRLPHRGIELCCVQLAEKVVEVVGPLREKLDAVLIFPSMPDVMRLNKVRLTVLPLKHYAG